MEKKLFACFRLLCLQGFVVDRYLRIASFVPEPFWYLSASATKDGKQLDFSWSRTRLFDEQACLAFYQRYRSNHSCKVKLFIVVTF